MLCCYGHKCVDSEACASVQAVEGDDACMIVSLMLGHAEASLRVCLQITGDNVLIARETARALGMGTHIRTAELLPQMMDDGRMPPHLGRDYGHIILPADGFAQVCKHPCDLYSNLPCVMPAVQVYGRRSCADLPVTGSHDTGTASNPTASCATSLTHFSPRSVRKQTYMSGHEVLDNCHCKLGPSGLKLEKLLHCAHL